MTKLELDLLYTVANVAKMYVENYSRGNNKDGKPLNGEWLVTFQALIDAVKAEEAAKQAIAPRVIRFRDEEPA